jgi:hypothetical protein
MVAANAVQIEVADFSAVLEVSESGYYAWRKHEVSFHAQQDEVLAKGITAVFEESRQTYGAQRVTCFYWRLCIKSLRLADISQHDGNLMFAVSTKVIGTGTM